MLMQSTELVAISSQMALRARRYDFSGVYGRVRFSTRRLNAKKRKLKRRENTAKTTWSVRVGSNWTMTATHSG